MAKKLLPMFLLCFLLAALLSVSAGAASDSGAWGDNITWKLNNDGVLTLSGKGDMEKVENYLPDWLKYTKEIKAVVIQEGITSIVSNAFLECENLTKIDFPSTVTTIGEAAFRQCSSLTEITIPGTVEKIDHFAFCMCTALQKATIQDGVKTIGTRIFEDCTNLTEISVPGSVRAVEYSLCTTSGPDASPIKKAIIPASFPDSTISSYPPFSKEFLEEITIVGSPDTIPSRSFKGCNNLKKVTILDGVTTIDEDAFYECENLKEVYLPASLTTIGWSAFYHCAKLENCVIPDSVTSIGRDAFSNCTALRKVIIPRGLTTIETNTFDQGTVKKYSDKICGL